MHNAGRRDWWWWWFTRPVRRAVAARYARGRHRAPPVYLPRSRRTDSHKRQINLLSRKTYLSTKMTDCIPRRPQRGRAPQGLSVHNLLREDAACAPASWGGDHSGTRLLRTCTALQRVSSRRSKQITRQRAAVTPAQTRAPPTAAGGRGARPRGHCPRRRSRAVIRGWSSEKACCEP